MGIGVFIPITDPMKFFHKIANDTNTVIIIDPAAALIGSCIDEILYDKYASDIYLLFDAMDQVYECISKSPIFNMEFSSTYKNRGEYKKVKFLTNCRREFRIYEKNRIYWIENMGVEKVKRKRGDNPEMSNTRPIPSYQPYEIFGCTLYHYKQGSFPGMTIEEMINKIRG